MKNINYGDTNTLNRIPDTTMYFACITTSQGSQETCTL